MGKIPGSRVSGTFRLYGPRLRSPVVCCNLSISGNACTTNSQSFVPLQRLISPCVRQDERMTNPQAGWYDDGSGTMRWWDGSAWTEQVQQKAPGSPGIDGVIGHIQAEAAAGGQPRPAQNGMSYVVLQVVLREKFFGTGSGNLTELEKAINVQAALGYRLHTITTASSGSTGFGGGDRLQATMVFERIN
ncbi:DUF2510 domain-containing protein [Curtobacterium flaccumfaciens]|uniref:DUF2510 domain-containing protein n=1 Tax=Curtobacterium flaccumfaciens TaxID=2035 RepID=UPI00217E78B0|nr:DUF2510 domain-containing protein [Curtobacterium flaccumfaciens]MCS6530504.1 DUF2510 domain-containing protein [Curtobacterium flaccumfaciens pv. flaccumfaciens]